VPTRRLGHLGNSAAPYLNFKLSDGPEILTANSPPFAFDPYTLAVTVDESVDFEATGAELGTGSAPPAIAPIVGTPKVRVSPTRST
jgi:hypothetical protein